MTAKRLRYGHSLSAFEMLSMAKREMNRQKENHRIQETLLYLNNAFNNNIEFKQIFIDICKGEKKSIRSKELKEIYKLFSQNKTSMCLLERLVDQQQKKLKYKKTMEETALSKMNKDGLGFKEKMNEQQIAIKANIKTSKNLQNQTQRDSQKNKNRPLSKKEGQRSSINSKQSQIQADQKEMQSLIHRVYCRLIEKILVKIAFYTMNNKFLNFISLNMLDLTKSLETMIRRLHDIKDLRLLQQIVFKVYRQNFIIENKIFEVLVDGGYIMSIDEFYRINGIDLAHKDVYERNSAQNQIELKSIRQQKVNLKEKIIKMNQKKDKQNIVKKEHIDRTNNQINQKYLFCVSQIKTILDQEDEQNQKDNETNSNKHDSISKTQYIVGKSQTLQRQKLSRFSSKIVDNTILDKEEDLRNSFESLQSSPNSVNIIPKRKLKNKKIFHHPSRTATFSPQFSKLIKQSYQSPLKLQGKPNILSDKLCHLKEFEQKNWNKSTNGYENQKGRISHKIQRNNSGIFPINKLLKLCQVRNTDQYKVQSIVGSDIKLPNDVRKYLKEQLQKMNHFYDPNQKEQSNFESEFQLLKSINKKISIDFDKETQYKIQTFSDQNWNTSLDKNEDLEKGILYSIQQSEEKKKQLSSLKLYKDSPIQMKSIQRIGLKNNSIFTANGVKNIFDSSEDYKQLKKERIKRISYLKIKQKLTNGNVSRSSTSTFLRKQKLSYKSNNSCHKKYHSGNQQIVGNTIQKTVEQLIKQSTGINNLQTQVTGQMYNKAKSLNKVFTHNENNIVKQSRKRVSRFQTLNPRFLNDDQSSAVEQKESCFKRKQKLKATTYYHNNSQPISPLHSPNKENIIGGFYEVYDVRNRRKFHN